MDELTSLELLYSKTLALMSEEAVARLRSTGDAAPDHLRRLGALVRVWEANGIVLDAIQAQVVLDSLLPVFIRMSAPKGSEIELFELGRQAGLAERVKRA